MGTHLIVGSEAYIVLSMLDKKTSIRKLHKIRYERIFRMEKISANYIGALAIPVPLD